MAGTAIARVLLAASITAVLAGCQGEGSPFGKKTGPGDSAAAQPSGGDPAAADGSQPDPDKAEKPAKATAKSVKLVDRDVEAPEVFSVTDMALWDGRPSLGGVWVASPDAVDPERVILRNAANGKFVIGALFRRERDNPGPALQISSDAATALGLLAGQPGKVSVTALRREEAPVTAPDASKPILDAAETVETETLDPVIAGADAAIAKTEGAAPAAQTQTQTKPKGLGLFRKKPKASDGPIAPEVSSTPIAGAPSATAPAAAPAPAAKAPAAKPPAAPAPAAKAPATGGGLIQIGIFSVEANAKRAADTLAKAGVSANVREEKAQGKPFWSVTAAGGAEALAKIKAAGFADAYMLKRG